MAQAADYVPCGNDVLFDGRDETNSHPGNIKFRNILDHAIKHYHKATTNAAAILSNAITSRGANTTTLTKETVVISVVNAWRGMSPSGKLLELGHDNIWYDMGDTKAQGMVAAYFVSQQQQH